jgi:nucleoside 2-deoxyribosyltransferase
MANVYFASAIENLSLEEVQAHYAQVANLLESHGFQMTNRNIRDRYLPQSCDSTAKTREIVENDLETLRRSDLLLVDYSIPNRNYVGCTCEIVYAYLWRKPVIVFVEHSGNGQRRWLRYHATYVCNTVSQALGYMVKNYT